MSVLAAVVDLSLACTINLDNRDALYGGSGTLTSLMNAGKITMGGERVGFKV